MPYILLVGCGGFLGSVARYLLSGWVQRLTENSFFPYGTMAVNITGCLIIGVLTGLAENRGILTPYTRAFLLIGMLGGFTTFSSFSYDTTALFRSGETLAAFANVSLQIILGLGATWLSYKLMQRI